MNRRSLVDLALAAYPKWWKARYGEEVSSLCDDLMAEGKAMHRLVVGLCIGAADARLRGTGIPPVASVHRGRTRAALAVDALAMLAAVPVMAWVAVTTGYRSVSAGGHVGSVHDAGHTVTGSLPGLSVASEVAGWAKFGLIVLAGALVVQLTGAWQAARPTGRPRWTLLRWAPATWTVVALGAAVVRGHYLPKGGAIHGNAAGAVTVSYLPGAHPTVAAACAVVAWTAVGLVFVSAAALVLCSSATDVETARLLRASRVGARLSVTGTLAAITSMAWAVGLTLQSPAPAQGSYSIITSSLRAWAGPLAAMVLFLAVLSWASVMQARRSMRVVERLSAAPDAPCRS